MKYLRLFLILVVIFAFFSIASKIFAEGYVTSTSWSTVAIQPMKAAFGPDGNIYVTFNLSDGRVYVYNQSGTEIRHWGISAGATHMSFPSGIAISTTTGNVFVTEVTGNRVHVFTSAGANVTTWGSLGSGNGQFHTPTGVAVDSSGNILVADSINARIQKFLPNGTYVSQFGTLGTGNGQFTDPVGVGVDSDGYIYVVDDQNSTIQKFDSNFNYISTIATSGSGRGQVNGPEGIFIDSHNDIFVADYGNFRVEKFASSTGGNSYLTFFSPNAYSIIWGMAVSTSTGNVFVVNNNGQKINVMTHVGDPAVTTDTATLVTATSTQMNGTITNIQGNNITNRGFEYGLTTAYGATTTEPGSFDVGSYSVASTTLLCNSTYHFRAYVEHDYDIARGSDQSFTTPACQPPVVATDIGAGLFNKHAFLFGTIVDSGGAYMSSYGFEYGLTTAYGATTTDTTSFYTGGFGTTTITLSPDTTYHFRAYAINSAGLSYGDDVTFISPLRAIAATHVLNQIDFTSAQTAVTQHGYNTSAIALDKNHNRLFVSDGANRILVYDISGGITDNMLATNVIGQADFTSSLNSNGADATASTTSGINEIVYDDTHNRLFVTDYLGGRVLIFDLSGGITNGMDATYVLGHTLFTDIGSGAGDSGLSAPAGIAYDSTTQNLYVTDQANLRVVVWNLAGGITNGMPASHVLGNIDLNTPGPVNDAGTFWLPTFLSFDEARHYLFVADSGNNRVLVFDVSGGITDGMDASYVLGQHIFITGLPGQSSWQEGLTYPNHVFYDPTDRWLFVGDNQDNRVSIFDLSTGITNGQNATYFLGQGTFDTHYSGLDDSSFGDYGLYAGVVYDPTLKRAYVGDALNYRTLIFDLTDLHAHTFLTGTTSTSYLDSTTAQINGTAVWSVSSGSLPNGLSINSSTGVISGTPTLAGTYPFELTLSDVISTFQTFTATSSYSITVVNEPVGTNPPSVTSDTASSITTTTGTLNGSITNTGGADAIERGFAYGTTANLSTVISTTTLGSQSGTGSFSSSVSSLTCATTYYFRAYTTNSAGTGYGSIASFTTSACVVVPDAPSQSSDSSSGTHQGHSQLPDLVTPPALTNNSSPDFITIEDKSVYQPQSIQIESKSQNSDPDKKIVSDKEKPSSLNKDTVVMQSQSKNATGFSFSDNIVAAVVGFQKAAVILGLAGQSLVSAIVFYLLNFSLSDLWYLPMRLWGLFLILIGVRRRNPPWGVIYDSVTLQPIDPAILTVLDSKGNEVTQVLTDINGRYGFLLNKGVYTITAQKTNYAFPSKRLLGKDSDSFYEHLYFGDSFTVPEDGYVAIFNIPMDPIGTDWNEETKKKMHVAGIYKRHSKIVGWTANILFGIGFVYSLFSLLTSVTLVNGISFGLYLVIGAFLILSGYFRPYGSITEHETGQPLSFGIVKVFSKTKDTIISKKVADILGRYYCLVPQGNFFVTVEKRKNDNTYTEVYQSKSFNSKAGIIRKNVEV